MGHNSLRWQAHNMAKYLCTVALVVLAAALAQAQYNNYYGYCQNYYNDYYRRYNDYNSQFNSYYLDQPAYAYGRQYRGVTVSYGPSGSGSSYPGFYSRNYGGAYNNYYNRYYNDYNNRFNNQQNYYSRYYNNNNNSNRFNSFNRNNNYLTSVVTY